MSPLQRATHALKTHFPHALTEEDFPNFSDAQIEDVKGAAYLSAARAVLTAIREPSEAMIERGISDGLHNQPSGDNPDTDRMATDTWQAMIDAALEQGSCA